MHHIVLVCRLVDRILAQDIGSALDCIAGDVELTIVSPERGSSSPEIRTGREAVREYFDILGGIVGFWRVRIVPERDRVLLLGVESYTTTDELEAEVDFMLVFHVRDGLVRRMLVVEDLGRERAFQPTGFRAAQSNAA